jgi:hypothetical protein
MVDKVALGKVSLLVICLSTAIVIPDDSYSLLLCVSNKYIHVCCVNIILYYKYCNITLFGKDTIYI